MKLNKLPRRNSTNYKKLVGIIIGTFSLAKKIRHARSAARLEELRSRANRQLHIVSNFAKVEAFPPLANAVRSLRSALRAA